MSPCSEMCWAASSVMIALCSAAVAGWPRALCLGLVCVLIRRLCLCRAAAVCDLFKAAPKKKVVKKKAAPKKVSDE